MNEPTIVVPTYWGTAGKLNYSQEEVVFDHPTPLDTMGTLPAFFDSLEILNEQNFFVSIIVVPNTEQIVSEAIKKINDLVDPYRDNYKIKIIHPDNLAALRDQLKQHGVSESSLDLLNVSNYAAVRNMCSLAGILNESKLTVFIDDDEVFVDPEFLNKARDFVGKEVNGETVHAVAGYYLQPDSYRIENKTSPDWAIPQWDKVNGMNNAFDKIIGEQPRLKVSPFVFGGNMVVDLETLMKVPFDPQITRGEDIDFLINLRIYGINFYLDNELAIKHLPPSAHRPEWKNLREDVKRFLYEKKKLDDHSDLPGLSPTDFDPYPGVFLKDDLEKRIIETATKLMEKYEKDKDEEGFVESQKLITMVKKNPYKNIDTKNWLIKITRDWQELTIAISGIIIPD